jgi:lipopolysaccharide exporter
MSQEPPPSIEATAVRGASWTIAAGLVARVLGLLGSVAITHFLDPLAVGEVGAAVVLVLLANQISTLGVGQFVLAKRSEGPRAVFHANLLHVALGVVALGVVIALASPLATLVKAPHAASFVPGMAVSVMLERISYVPERIVIRELRFRRIAGTRAVADIANTTLSLSLAMAGFGGWAIVIGNIARSAIKAAVYIASAERAEWLAPYRFSKAVYRSIFRFGVPVWLGAISEFAASRMDNLIVSFLFGPRVMAQYQVAYNLADVPADQIGEQVAEVLLPSFAKMTYEERKRAVVSSTGLLAFVVFPIAIGFGAVAATLIKLVLRPVWAPVAPMLALLCVLSVLRPLTWQLGAYLFANDRPRVAMACSFAKFVVIVSTMLTIGRLGPMFACVSVGCGYAVALLIAQYSISRADGIPMTALIGRTVPALLACIPMVIAVLAVRLLLERAGVGPHFGLPLEILAGVLGFVAGAFTLAREMTREFLAIVSQARRRRRA